MESIPVHRVAVLNSFVRFLVNAGTPVERGFRQAGLPWNALEQVDNYVPSHNFYKFLVCMANSEGIPDLGFRVGAQSGAESADPNMTALLTRSPTLYQGLCKASERLNRTVTNCRLGILQPTNCGYSFFFS
jgi:hypothetical protein